MVLILLLVPSKGPKYGLRALELAEQGLGLTVIGQVDIRRPQTGIFRSVG